MSKKKAIIFLLAFLFATILFCHPASSMDELFQDVDQEFETENDDIPEAFKLNPHFIFDRETIEEWVEENSWEDAYITAWENHTQEIRNGIERISGTIITPVVRWTQINYMGEQRFYDEETIKRNYYSLAIPLEISISFRIAITSTRREDTRKENIRLILEDKPGEHREIKDEHINILRQEENTILGTNVYYVLMDIYFFLEEEVNMLDYQENLKLHILYDHKITRDTLTWKFSEVDIEKGERKNLTDALLENFFQLDEASQVEVMQAFLSVSPESLLWSGAVITEELEGFEENIVEYISKYEESLEEYPEELLELREEELRLVFKLGLDFLSIEQIEELFFKANKKNGEEIVEFEDPNLEKVVREEINKPEKILYANDVRNITKLVAHERKIESLEGIQYLENLEELHFGWNEVADIAPLANLTNLKWLRFYGNEVSDISPLANLTNLERLELDWNEASDISPLSNLSNMEELYLSRNEVSDIGPLAELSNLEGLYLSKNEVSDISPLANLSNLEWMNLSDNEVSDISPLSNLYNLKWLWFSHNEVADISPLANLSNLKHLYFYGNEVSDISPLTNLSNMEVLILRGNEVSDISPLVKNDGFGAGIFINMCENHLDLTEGSEDVDNINTLIDRGVDVEYETQKEE